MKRRGVCCERWENEQNKTGAGGGRVLAWRGVGGGYETPQAQSRTIGCHPDYKMGMILSFFKSYFEQIFFFFIIFFVYYRFFAFHGEEFNRR